MNCPAARVCLAARTIGILIASSLLFGASGGAQPARAADPTAADLPAANPEALEEVVVTATKQSRELSKVPISISAYTQQMMDDRAIRNISDVVAQTPGLNLGDQGSNGVGDRISIRGIDSNSGASTTGVYIDDTPLQARSNPVNLAGSTFPEVFDLERVEVLRGPQGTLFGAGAEGGVVRFITPAPSLSKDSVYARAEASFTAHGDPSYEAGAAFGGPVMDNVLGIRISGWARHSGGWVDRLSWQTGERFSKSNWSDAGGGRLALLWKPGDAWRVTPSVLYQGSHDNDTPDFWSSLSNPQSGRFVNGYAARQQSTEHFVLPSLKIEWDAGAVAWTSITSFFYRRETNTSDVTNYDIAGALGGVGANGEDNFFPTVASGAPVLDLFQGASYQNIFTQELRLQNADPDARVRWVTGLYFQNSRLNDTQLAPNPQQQNLFDQQQGVGAFSAYYYDPATCTADCSGLYQGIYEYVGSEYSRDQQLALFGNVDWSFTKRLTLNAGLRVEQNKSDFVAIENGPVNNGASIGGGHASATPLTPKLGLSFQADPDTLYYGSVAKGYRQGGGNSHVPPSCSLDLGNIGLSAAPTNYDSDSTWSYELGTKQRAVGGRLSIDASVYYIDWRNIQWYYFLPNCGYGVVFNLGGSTSTGFDLDLNAKLTPDLLAGLSIGYNDAKFKDTVALGGAPVVFNGQTLGQTPWTIYSSLEYRFALGQHSGFYARVTNDFRSANTGPYGYQYTASAVYDPDLKPGPSVNQLDLRLGRKWQGIDVSLFVNNALDAAPNLVNPQASHYVGYDFNSGNPVSSPIYSYSTLRPRTIGITGTFNY
jgi:iron complex outermembrane recepter protein